MRRVGKDVDGKVMFITEDELRKLKETGGHPRGNNQQRAKIRKMVTRLDKPKY